MAKHPFLMIPTRNIKRNKLRSILLIVGVALTVALQIGIAVSVDSLISDFVQQQRNHNYTDITVRGKTDLNIDSLKTLIPSFQTLDGLGSISPVTTRSLVEFIDEEQISPNAIFYACTSSHPDFKRFNLLDGKRSLKFGEVILTESLKRILRVEIGESFELLENSSLGFSGGTFTVSAIISDTYPFGNLLDNDFFILNIDFFHSLFNNTNKMNSYLAIEVKNLINVNDISYDLTDKFPDLYIIREKHIDSLRASGLEAYNLAMILIIIASYLIEALFISNIFAIVMKERSKEFGTLRAVGTSRPQIGIFIMIEILLIALIGAIVGAFLGLGLAVILLAIFKYYLKFATLSALVLEPSTIFLSIMTGIIVTILSGFWPLLVAIRQPIVQNIHTLSVMKKKKRLINWKSALIVGVFLIISGVILSNSIGTTEFLGFQIISLHSLVVVLIFGGALAIEGALISFLPKLGVKFLTKRTNTSLLIAFKDIERDLQKSTIIIFTAALTLSFILIIGMVASGLIDGVPKFYEESFGDNDRLLVIETWDHLEYPKNFTETLESNFSYMITHASYMQEQRATLSSGASAFVFGVNSSSYSYFLDSTILKPEGSSLNSLFNLATQSIVITNSLADRLDLGIGNSIGLIDSNGSTSIFQIVGICEGNPFIHGGEYLYIDTSLFQQLWLKSSVKWFMADVDITYVIPDAEANIESFFPDLKSVQTTYSYISLLRYSLQTQGAFINLIFVHSFLLSGLTQFIGILITTLRMEREVAIMRALGLSTVDVLGLFLTESSILGFTGVVVGIINSSIGASLLAWYISLSIPIQVALNSIRDQFLFMLWIGLSIVVTLASTYIPSKRASEVNIIAAISGRREMKDAIGIYEPVEFDVKAVIETMNVPVERKIGPGKQVEDAEIQDLIAKITKYKDKIDLEVKEDKDWFDLYQSQQTKYRNGELDSLKFSYTARRFLNYLKEK